MEGRRRRKGKNVLGGWNLGAGGCRGDVIGPEQEASEKQVSLFILILFAVPVGVGGEGGGEGGGFGGRPRQGLLGNGKGCQAGPTANIRSSHLCSQKPGVLPKASFQLHGMITLDVGQLLRACSPSLPPSLTLPLCSLPRRSLSLSLFFHCLQKLSAKHAAVAMAAENGT